MTIIQTLKRRGDAAGATRMKTPWGIASAMPTKTVHPKTNHSISLSKAAHGVAGPAQHPLRVSEFLTPWKDPGQLLRCLGWRLKASRRARI